MPISVKGKSIIVTGAGKGIGRGIARVMAADGANVVVVSRNENDGNAVVDEIRAANGGAHYFKGDVRDRSRLDAMVDFTIGTYGRLDVLSLNAGIYTTSLIEDMEEELWTDTIDTNLKGVLYAVQAAIPVFKKQKSGRVIVTSSITGPRVGFPGLAAYSASKVV